MDNKNPRPPCFLLVLDTTMSAEELQDADIWEKDARRASALHEEEAALRSRTREIDEIEAVAQNALEMAELALLEGSEDDEDGDARMILLECIEELGDAAKRARKVETLALLGGPSDKCGCFIEVKAGAGGAESQDWASMLISAYTGWGKQKGYAVELVEEARTDVGIRDGVLKVDGLYAYGWLRTEMGVHRMVRHSEHGSGGKRQTCFAQVIVIPVAEASSTSTIDIPPGDIRIETFRSGGPGGQHANTTDSAVRMVHIPTGIKASCQAGRSQLQNKELCLQVLKSRVAAKEEEERAKERDEIYSGLGDNAFGSQLRSYVFHPYQMVKDHRTGVETSQIEKWLSGDADCVQPFLEAALRTLPMPGTKA